ncbi:MAG: hypothetical protein ORO03_07545, partial [Alphaproteobacteria bacterium]|nr:hypothetical protein [Alphaproteobacteria bacterium]
PELQGRSFSEVYRTVNHDNFGLAVLIFQLLMMGRHPYAGRYLGQELPVAGGESGDMGIERAIREDLFAYSQESQNRVMEPPPHSLRLDSLPAAIARLFELAFARDSRLKPRPTAKEWVTGLTRLEHSLAECAVNPSHHYFPGIPSQPRPCPWCRIEQNTAVHLFNLTIPELAVGHFDHDKLWRHIQRSEPPGPAPAPPPASRLGKLTPSRAARMAADQQSSFTPIVALSLLGIAGFSWFLPRWWWVWGLGGATAVAVLLLWRRQSPTVARFEERLKRERQSYRIVLENWEMEAGDRRFLQHLLSLERLRQEWLDLPKQRARLLDLAMAGRREGQLRQYLESISLRHATIKGIGAARKGMLQSYLIETAFDLRMENLTIVPGIGSELRSTLLGWRSQIEKKFKFDETRPPDPEAMLLLDYDFARIQRPIEQKLLSGVTELSQIRNQILKQRQALGGELNRARTRLHQAEIDLQEVKG